MIAGLMIGATIATVIFGAVMFYVSVIKEWK